MNEELKRLQAELQTLVSQMRTKVEEEGDATKASGLAVEQYTKINERIDEIEADQRALLKHLRTPAAGGRPQDDTDLALRGAMVKYLKKGDRALNSEDRAALERHTKALSVDSDPDGGFWVTPALSSRIIETIKETTAMRQVATVETIGSDALEGPYDDDEADAGWVGERQARPQTDTPQIGQWRIPTHELYANPAATQKLLDDAGHDVEAWLARKVAEKFARIENAAFVKGDGVGKPRGFTTYPDGSNRGQIRRIPSGGATGVTAEGVINVIYAIKGGYLTGARWLMNRATIGAIRTLRSDSGAGAGTGNFLWQPGLQAGEPSTLGGYPILDAPDMDNISGGNIVAGFGNFGAAYTIVDRIGIRTLRDPFTAKPYVLFYTTKRVGGDVLNFESIVLMDIAAS